jgi:hypothetical protein
MGEGRRRSTLSFTAACDASAVPRQDRASDGRGSAYLKARAHMWGTLWGEPFDTLYIIINRGRLSQTWVRSAQTHRRWTLNSVEGAGLPILDMCSILFMSPGGVPTNTPTRYTYVGQAAIAGAVVWHVRMAVNPPGEHWRFDWYIARSSFRVLRSITAVWDSSSRSTNTYDYSRFGVPVRVTVPSG